MGNLHRMAAAGAALALVAGVPARADGVGEAEKLRRLDIMLMVTGLRCRNTPDNFQADFQAFEANHLAELNGAARDMRAQYVGRLGARGADRELDRLSVTMANEYGNGHPWLGCHELAQATHGLAEAKGQAPLLAAADELLGGDGPQIAYAAQ